MELLSKIKIAAVIAIIAGPFLTFNGHQEKERLAKLEKDGVTVEGVIEGGEWNKGGRRRSSSYSFNVVFKPDGGTPVTKSFKVNATYFAAHASEKESAITDPAVKVRYVPGDVQESAIIEGGSTDNTVFFPIGIGALSVGALTLLGLFVAKK